MVAAEGGFHGRTMGALALTGQPAKRTPFEPLPGDVTFVPYGDAPALRPRSATRTATVVLEPIQGEGGVVPAPAGYLAAARAGHRASTARCSCSTRCRPASAAPARGSPTRPTGVEPDVVTLAKGLGGGLPIGACLAFGDAADAARRPASTAPRSAATRSPARPRSPCSTRSSRRAARPRQRLGERLPRGIEGLGHPLVADVRGAGLLLGIVAHRAGRGRRRGGGPGAPGSWSTRSPRTSIRLAPPLILTDAQADAFVAALPGILDAAMARRIPPVDRHRPKGRSVTRHFLRDDDLSPAEQAEVLDLADRDEGRPVRPAAAGRAAGGRGAVRQAVDPHPGVVRGRHRRARRLPAGHRRADHPVRPGRADRGHRAGAGPAVRGDRLADLRPGPARRAGRGQPRCRWSTR